MKLHTKARWNALARREKTALGLMCVTVVLATTWWVLLAPALQTLDIAPERKAQLQADLQRMQAMADDLSRLKSTARPLPNRVQALTALQTVTTRFLGNYATIAPQGETITVSLKGVEAPALASWLQAVRLETGLRHQDIRIALQTGNGVAPDKSKSVIGWHGQVVLSLHNGSGS